MGLLKARPASSETPAPDAAAGGADLDTLVAGLGSTDPSERRASAKQLGAHPGALPSLARALGDETDRAVQQALIGALATIGGIQAVTALVAQLRSPSAAARSLVLDALTGLGAVGVAALHVQLHDQDPHVRISAIVTLAGLPDVATESLLLHLLVEEAEPNVLAAAVETLAQVGTAASIPALEALALRFPDNPFLVFASRTVMQSLAGGRG